MTLVLMQPYFFPYIGYFGLIAMADRFVVFDTPQYTPQSWMNRNRILHPQKGWQYLSLPVRNVPEKTPVHNVTLINLKKSRCHTLGQIAHYARNAPYYTAVGEILAETFARCRSDSLVEINVASLAVTCEYLGLPFAPELWSRTSRPLPPISSPGGWALEIASALGADHYLNAPGGRALFLPQDFAGRGIGLSFLELPPMMYACPPYAFEPQLSILDVLMWNAPSDVLRHLATARMDTVVPPSSATTNRD